MHGDDVRAALECARSAHGVYAAKVRGDLRRSLPIYRLKWDPLQRGSRAHADAWRAAGLARSLFPTAQLGRGHRKTQETYALVQQLVKDAVREVRGGECLFSSFSFVHSAFPGHSDPHLNQPCRLLIH